MQAIITFLEGLITFISPCVLPMIPVYVLYFTGGEKEANKGKTLLRALCFVAGFTTLFVLMGVFAGTLGAVLIRYQRMVSLITGAVVVFFGLHYAGILRIGALERTMKPDVKIEAKGYLSCALLGAVFSVGWSPCTGPFLGSAMMMAATQGQVLSGVVLLLAYSLGLGVPFVLCALLIDRLKGAFAFIKRHYGVINRVCGVFLILVGVLMMSGLYSRLSSMLPSFGLQNQAEIADTVTAKIAPEAAQQSPVVTDPPQATQEPAQKSAETAGPVQRNMAKDFTAYDVAGEPVNLSDFRGKPVVVNFFASWCGPCRLEMPYFEECYKQYGDQVQFLMVNLCGLGNDTKAAAEKMIEEGGYTFPVVYDTDGDAALTYVIRSMPTTIFVSAEGELKGRHTGMISEETLFKTVEAMAAQAQ